MQGYWCEELHQMIHPWDLEHSKTCPACSGGYSEEKDELCRDNSQKTSLHEEPQRGHDQGQES